MAARRRRGREANARLARAVRNLATSTKGLERLQLLAEWLDGGASAALVVRDRNLGAIEIPIDTADALDLLDVALTESENSIATHEAELDAEQGA